MSEGQDKKPTTGLFGAPSGSIFGKSSGTSGGLFGASAPSTGGLFGAKPAEGSKPMFGQPSDPNAPKPNMFGQKTEESKSLFAMSKPSDQPKETAETKTPAFGGSLFGKKPEENKQATGSGLFGG